MGRGILLTTANNHCLDRGIKGLSSTVRYLDSMNIPNIGCNLSKSREHSYYIQEIDGKKYGFITYTYGTNAAYNREYLSPRNEWAVNLFRPQENRSSYIRKQDYYLRIKRKLKRLLGIPAKLFTLADTPSRYLEQIKKDIANCRLSGAEIIFCLMHSGGQYNDTPEEYTRDLAQWLLDNGVDHVIGSHPHVIHPISIVGNQLKAYSLGDFTSYPYCDGTPMENAHRNHAFHGLVLHYETGYSKIKDAISCQIVKSVIGDDGISRVYLLSELIERENNPQLKQQYLFDEEWLKHKIGNEINV